MESFASAIEQKMIDHMNADHVEAMRDYCKFANVKLSGNEPKMTAIDPTGFDLSVNGKRVRFYFKQRCTTPEEVRTALVALAEKARM